MRPALSKASAMMNVPIGQLPYAAVMYSKFLSKKYGFCGEVLITAYAAYAQKMEAYECAEAEYKVSEQDWDDFIKGL